jgi:hypothetical protein
MVLLNPETYQVEEEFQNFWPTGFVPMKCCVGKNFEKVYGYSFNTTEGVFTILDVNMAQKTVITKVIKIPIDQKWVGLEMSTDGKYLIVTNAYRK